MIQHCFGVRLQKCFMEDFPLVWGCLDNHRVLLSDSFFFVKPGKDGLQTLDSSVAALDVMETHYLIFVSLGVLLKKK